MSHKRVLAKQNKNGPIFYNIIPISLASLHTWGQKIEPSLSEPCAKVCQAVPKLFNKQVTKSFILLFFKTPGPVHRPTVAAVSGRKMSLDGATDFLSQI